MVNLAIAIQFVVWSFFIQAAQISASDSDPVPFVFSLGNISDDNIELLKKTPGVEEVVTRNDRCEVKWKFWTKEGDWTSPDKYLNDAAFKLYPFLCIKEKVGNTQWTHGGPCRDDPNSITPFSKTRMSFAFMFNDQVTGHNELMRLRCFNDAEPGQVVHEMLRDAIGTELKFEQCGSGTVVTSKAIQGTFLVWQVNEQMFVRVESSFDRKMVAAYIQRLGCITKKDLDLSVDKWILDEIRWRMKLLDNEYRLRLQKKSKLCGVSTLLEFFQSAFPAVPRKAPKVINQESTLLQEWEHLQYLRNWLWANHDNFQYNEGLHGFGLKDKDKFDPDNPPVLPDEMKGPEKPSPDQIAACSP